MRWNVLLAAALAACAPTTASREPLHYPALRGSNSGSSLPVAFVPAAEAVATTLTCAGAEPALANALDDDCDGRIDGADDAAPLTLVLAYPRALAPRFFFRDSADRPETPIAAPACSEPAPFCVLRIDTAALPHGQHDLWVARSGDDGAPLPSSLLVSVRAEGKLETYLLRLEHSEPRRVGQLSLP